VRFSGQLLLEKRISIIWIVVDHLEADVFVEVGGPQLSTQFNPSISLPEFDESD
jgi:hypothetical protein